MSEQIMTLCPECADKMDAAKHPESSYYLEMLPGSVRPCRCAMCQSYGMHAQYQLESKSVRAMRREYARRQREGAAEKKDHRARWREPWRGERE